MVPSVATAGVIETIEYADDARIAAAVSDRHELVTLDQDPGDEHATARTVAFLTAAFAPAAAAV